MRVIVCLLASAAVALVYVCGKPRAERLSARVLQDPQRVTIDGKSVVYYELQLRNAGSDTLHVRSVEVSGRKPLLSITGRALKDRITSTVIVPQTSATLYIELDNLAVGDNRLSHRVEYTTSPNQPNRSGTSALTVVASVIKTPAVVLAAPLRGGPWAAIYSPVWSRGHRRVLFSFDGIDYLPGRFAIDFMLLDSAGRYASGNEDSIANWYGYQQPVLAVAAGEVVAVRDDFAESATLSGHPVYTAADATGNFVAIDIGQGCIVFYEHLKPESIRVSKGDKVRAGQTIGAVGFTGQSTGPHLHLHVANAPVPLRAQGLPFVFKGFQRVGHFPDFGVFGKSRWAPAEGSVEHERPAPNTVIRF